MVHPKTEGGDGSQAEHGQGEMVVDAPESLRSIALLAAAPGPASIDVLSITLVPRGASFLDDTGARPITPDGTTRHSIFTHTPASLSYPVILPAEARLDFGLAVSRGDTVTYRVSARHNGAETMLFEETIEDPDHWHQRSVELSALDGEAEIELEATSALEGAVALWGAPILSGTPTADRPNVIFYVIDGVVFTRAYSNSTWTQPSTVSFMTSLQHSVLGGLRRGVHSTPVPTAATTMAEHFRRGGYQTASFTSNPNAGRLIGLERGVDLMRDVETEHHSTSSIDLHRQYWDFRKAYAGGPTWSHLQTTDVHEPNQPEAPFAGRFVSPEEVAQLEAWDRQVWQTAGRHFGTTSIAGFYDLALEKTGIDRYGYFSTRKGQYDETMLHQDFALQELVGELKDKGEWENTLLIIGADHGHPAGTFARFGRGLFDPQPAPWQGALFDAYATRIPLIVIWPGQIEGGRTFDQPVSMLDVLPTLLDLLGMPAPEVLQGQSLAPLLRGHEMEVSPVILDEFRVDEATGEMVGNLEIIDGRWGASIEIGPAPEGENPRAGRHAVPAGGRWGAVHPFFPVAPRLLLYDLEEDPFALRAVNTDHPELVKEYTKVLFDQWQAHRALATRFEDASDVPLSPEQLEQLRALGYIQ